MSQAPIQTSPDKGVVGAVGVPPRYRKVLGGTRESWISWVVFVVTVVLVLAPIVPTLWQALLSTAIYDPGGTFTLSNFGHLFGSSAFLKVIWNSVRFGLLTTVIAVVMSVVLAVLLVRVKVRGARFFNNFLLWPIYISPLVLAVGFWFMYSPSGFVTLGVQQLFGLSSAPWNLYSIHGMAITEAVATIPLGYLYCSNALRQADPSLENAARSCGAGPVRILFTVVLPMLRPPIIYAALLIFSTAMESLSVPLLFGRPNKIDLFASYIYFEGVAAANPDYGLVGAAAVVTLVILVALVTVQGIALRNSQRFVSVRGKAARPRRLDLGKWNWVGFAVVVLYAVFGPLLPLIGLVARSVTFNLTPLLNPLTLLTTSNFSTAFSTPTYVQSIKNSVLIALVGGVLMTLFVSVVVLIARRTTFRFARALEFFALAPQAIPGLLLGIGFFWAFKVLPGGDTMSTSIFALVIAFGVRGMPQAFGGIAPIVMQIGRELDNAARSMGADWWRTFSRILFKLILPGVFVGFTLLFVQMVKEFTPAVFLSGVPVIGSTVLQLWLNGETGAVAALSVVQVVITAVFIIVAQLLLRNRSNTDA